MVVLLNRSHLPVRGVLNSLHLLAEFVSMVVILKSCVFAKYVALVVALPVLFIRGTHSCHGIACVYRRALSTQLLFRGTTFENHPVF